MQGAFRATDSVNIRSPTHLQFRNQNVFAPDKQTRKRIRTIATSSHAKTRTSAFPERHLSLDRKSSGKIARCENFPRIFPHTKGTVRPAPLYRKKPTYHLCGKRSVWVPFGSSAKTNVGEKWRFGAIFQRQPDREANWVRFRTGHYLDWKIEIGIPHVYITVAGLPSVVIVAETMAEIGRLPPASEKLKRRGWENTGFRPNAGEVSDGGHSPGAASGIRRAGVNKGQTWSTFGPSNLWKPLLKLNFLKWIRAECGPGGYNWRVWQ